MGILSKVAAGASKLLRKTTTVSVGGVKLSTHPASTLAAVGQAAASGRSVTAALDESRKETWRSTAIMAAGGGIVVAAPVIASAGASTLSALGGTAGIVKLLAPAVASSFGNPADESLAAGDGNGGQAVAPQAAELSSLTSSAAVPVVAAVLGGVVLLVVVLVFALRKS